MDVRPELEIVDQVLLGVFLHLLMAREKMAPACAGREGELVECNGRVAGAAGIGVRGPSAADAVSLLENDEVVEACLFEFDAGREAAETRADDRNRWLATHVHAPLSSWLRVCCGANGGACNG